MLVCAFPEIVFSNLLEGHVIEPYCSKAAEFPFSLLKNYLSGSFKVMREQPLIAKHNIMSIYYIGNC